MVDPKANSPQVGATAESSIHQASDETHGETAQYRVKADEFLPRGFGRYELRALLGRGGMGAVYQAYDPVLDRLVALKIPKALANEIDDWRERFKVEARAAATIQHPNICPVYEVGEINGQPYLTMPLIEGETLASRLRRLGRMPIDEALSLVSLIARSMSEAHQRGIVHRDLKPANIMIDRRGQPIVMDFGLAYRTVGASDLKVTLSGVAMGTPEYMPPEQAGGDHEAIGPSSDVYSLGVVLNELVTGRVPFLGKSFGKLVAQIERDPPPSPSQLNPEVNSALESVILKSLEKQPSDRFSSAIAFANALDAVQRGESIGTLVNPKNTSAALVVTSQARVRRRWPLVLGAIASLSIFALLSYSILNALDFGPTLEGTTESSTQPIGLAPNEGAGGHAASNSRKGRVQAPAKALEVKLASWSILTDASKRETEAWLDEQRQKGHSVMWLDVSAIDSKPIYAGLAAHDQRAADWVALLDISEVEANNPAKLAGKVDHLQYSPRSLSGFPDNGSLRCTALFHKANADNCFVGAGSLYALENMLPQLLSKGYHAQSLRAINMGGNLVSCTGFFVPTTNPEAKHGLNVDERNLARAMESLRAKGLRPYSIAAITVNGNLQFTFPVLDKPSKQPWEYHLNLTSAELAKKSTELAEKGFQPESVTVYPWDGHARYCSIWVKAPTSD